jgi:hypothetical protein
MSTNQPYNNQNKNQPNVKPEVVSPQPNKMPETANSSKEKPANHTDTAHSSAAKPVTPVKPADATKRS